MMYPRFDLQTENEEIYRFYCENKNYRILNNICGGGVKREQ